MIPAALLPLPSKTSQKEAVAIFTQIMLYMGDLPGKRDPIALAQGIVECAVRLPELRDEIFCQLIKQMTRHPNPYAHDHIEGVAEGECGLGIVVG